MIEYIECFRCKYYSKPNDAYPCNKCTHNAVNKFCIAKNSDLLQVDDIQEQAELIKNMIYDTVSYLFDDEGNVNKSEIIKWLQREVKESD